MELFDIVDKNGSPTGKTAEREYAHSHGLRHRTSHVWLLRLNNGRVHILLQKRSADKDSFPGCYDISSAGHIPAGDGFVESALRELYEELGVIAGADELVFCGQRQVAFEKTFHGREFRDNQVSNVYVLRRDTDAEDFIIQRSELESVEWMDFDACVNMVLHDKAPHCISAKELAMVASVLHTVFPEHQS